MKVITGVGGWPASIPEQARVAEAEGFDCLTCGELDHDSILIMTVAATATERIDLQTSVTIAFPRSPFVLAMEAWDLQHLSRGRFCLGLGSQVKGHNERRFAGTWSPPAPRMREYIQMMHAVWDSWQDGKPAEFLGKQYTYTLMTPNFNPGPIEFERPKVGLAIVGPGMARVTGEVADIAMPHGGIMSDKYMREVLLPAIREGLERSGRTWADIDVAESGYLILGEDDSEIEQKALAMRRTLSFYGSTRTYHKVLALHGLEDLGMKLHRLSLQGKWDEMRDTVTVDDILTLAQTSTYDGLPDFLGAHREYASRTSLAGVPRGTPAEEERFRDVLARVQAVETPGVPQGLDMPGGGGLMPMVYDPDNIFAKILRGEADAHVVLDETHCMAFMDLMPQSPGHTLVIPREPAANLFDLSPDAWQAVTATTRRVAEAVRAAFQPPGMMLMQLNGADAGQTVFHLHFHVVPRYEGEGLAFHARTMADPAVLAEHAARIRGALGDG